MRRLAFLLLPLVAACAAPATPPPMAGSGTARLVLPTDALAGATFTASTPFTNSIPYTGRSLAIALSAPSQVVEFVDPRSGLVIARQAVAPGPAFALPPLPTDTLLYMQVILRDGAGGLHGLLAAPYRPGEAARVISPGSTVAPVAAALAIAPDAAPTMGQGFAGRPRPLEARMLAMLPAQARDRAVAAYDPLMVSEGSGVELMGAIAEQASRVAEAIASPSTSPEALGLRMGEVLGTPVTPTPAPSPWIGRGPAIPAPWHPR